MIYTAIDNFYLTDEQLQNTPSRKDGIDEATETTLRIYGCDLIQESGILLKLPQAVMAAGQVLFHRFYCKKSFARFDVKIVAASSLWLASKLEESPTRAKQVILVFHRMECRRENLPIEHLDLSSKKYGELKAELSRTERHILKEMGFVCHVEHPHEFISNYLATLTLGTPIELRQEAWNLANDSLRTTLCVHFKSEVVACGVVYAAAQRFQVPLPENPQWWKAFYADKSGIDEVCRVLARLYSLPKAQYIAVLKDRKPFTFSTKSGDSQSLANSREAPVSSPPANDDANFSKSAPLETHESKEAKIKAALDKLKDSKLSDDESKSMPVDGEAREELRQKCKSEHRTETSGDKIKERDRERERDRDRAKARDRDSGRDANRERDPDETERYRDKVKDRDHRSKDRGRDSGHSEKLRHHSSRDRDYQSSSYSSREKDRHRHHSYA
ncbi:hypothetical protein SLA2020_391980 [Shorea laevis]